MADKIVTLHPYNNKSDNLYPRVLGKSVQAGTNIAIDTTANTISVAQSLIDTINGKQAKGDYATNSTLTNNYYTKPKVDDLLANKQNSGNYALKSEIPTKTSQLTNDSGYLISSDLKTSISVVSNPYDDPDDEDDDNNTMTSLVVSVGGVSASTLTDELKVAYAKNAYSAQYAVNANNATNAIYTRYLGTSTSAYSKELLDIVFEKKQDKVKQLGNDTTPVYVSANGTFSACTDYSQASVKHADNATKATSANSAIRATYASSLGEPDSNYNYETLNSALNAKQNTIPTTGSDTEPVYFSNAGTIAKAKLYAGGTKVKLNGSDQGGSSVSFYAPTSYGSVGYVLTSGESASMPPYWANPSSLSVGRATSASYANAIGTSSSNYTKSTLDTALNSKQNTLVSGTNIKTINGTSLLGSGNIAIAGNMVIGSTDIVYNNENIENGTFYSALAVSHKAVLGVYVHYLSNDPYYDEIFQTCIYNFRAEDGDPAQTGYTADFYYYGQNGLTPVPAGSTIRIVYIN